MLRVEDFRAAIDDKEIVKGVSFDLEPGEVIYIIGPNGSGKSTLLSALMGKPRIVTSGRILLDGQDISKKPTRERAQLGLGIAFQNPVEVDVKASTLLRKIAEKFGTSDEEYREIVKLLRIEHLLKRYANKGFSGGERKRFEIARLLIQKPKYALLDEPDSGVDPDNMNIICSGIRRLLELNSGLVIVSHYIRILRCVEPDHVYVMYDGRFVKEGDASLAREVLENGFASVLSKRYSRTV